MDKSFFKSIALLVNDPTIYPMLQSYVDKRIDVLRTQLETAKEHHRILEIQGAIHELRRFKTLREEVTKGAQ